LTHPHRQSLLLTQRTSYASASVPMVGRFNFTANRCNAQDASVCDSPVAAVEVRCPRRFSVSSRRERVSSECRQQQRGWQSCTCWFCPRRRGSGQRQLGTVNSKPDTVPPPSHALSLRDPLPDGRGISVPSCAFGLPEVPVPALVKRKPGSRDGDASTASYALDDKRLCVALSGPVFDDELHWDRGFFRFSNCPNL
jgi:hypothetical protein